MKLRSSWPTVASTMRSIRGWGKLSFEQANYVNAESPLSICLFDKDYIGQPVGVVYFSYSSSVEEFSGLFIDRFLPLWGEAPLFLFDEFEGRIDFQHVGDNCGVNTSHALLLPSKHLCVFPQKANEAIFDVFSQLGLDVGEVVRLVA